MISDYHPFPIPLLLTMPLEAQTDQYGQREMNQRSLIIAVSLLSPNADQALEFAYRPVCQERNRVREPQGRPNSIPSRFRSRQPPTSSPDESATRSPKQHSRLGAEAGTTQHQGCSGRRERMVDGDIVATLSSILSSTKPTRLVGVTVRLSRHVTENTGCLLYTLLNPIADQTFRCAGW